MSSSFTLEPLKKAVASLHEALALEKTPIVRDAVIQRFEYTYELAWKAMRRYFKINNQLEEEFVRDIFREASKQGLIESAERWFSYQEARNRTSHTYNERTADEVYDFAGDLARDSDFLIQRLENLVLKP